MVLSTVRIIGIDPGLRRTGWGLIVCEGTRLSHLADGVIVSDQALTLAERLVQLRSQLTQVISEWRPDEAAVEETFVNTDARATLKLGQARGIALLVPAEAGMVVAEYAPNQVKKTVVGAGHAEKQQIHHMVKVLLPRAQPQSADAADALAIAICHAHHRGRQNPAVRLARS
jgi:crossover junction endodeoxyribonuclease RuvC